MAGKQVITSKNNLCRKRDRFGAMPCSSAIDICSGKSGSTIEPRSAIDCTAHKSISGCGLGDVLGKQRTNNGTRDLMMRSGEECEGAVGVADPDLGGSASEIENAFFGDLGCGIGGRED